MACSHGVPEDHSLHAVIDAVIAADDADRCREQLRAAEPLIAAARIGLDPRARAQARTLDLVASLLQRGHEAEALEHVRSDLGKAVPAL